MRHHARGGIRAHLEALIDAEAVLLVDDRKTEILKLHGFLNKSVRTHHHACLARADHFLSFGFFLGLEAAGEPEHVDAERLHPGRELFIVLLGKKLGRGHECGLRAAVDRAQGCKRRNHGLAAPDVALYEPMHRVRAVHVGVDL